MRGILAVGTSMFVMFVGWNYGVDATAFTHVAIFSQIHPVVIMLYAAARAKWDGGERFPTLREWLGVRVDRDPDNGPFHLSLPHHVEEMLRKARFDLTTPGRKIDFPMDGKLQLRDDDYVERSEFRLLLVVHTIACLSTHTLAGLDQ